MINFKNDLITSLPCSAHISVGLLLAQKLLTK